LYAGLINEEVKWLSSLEEKLSRGVISTSADAEELSEELDVIYHLYITYIVLLNLL